MGNKRGGLSTVSMTGFGGAAGQVSGAKVDIEVKSLNNRYSDISLRLPREYSSLEPDLRELIAKYVQRGRVELSVSRRADAGTAGSVVFNKAAFEAILKTYLVQGRKAAVADKEFLKQAVVGALAKREIFEVSSGGGAVKPAELSGVLKIAAKALANLKATRVREGQSLGRDIQGRLGELSRLHAALEKQSAGAPARAKTKLQQRLDELTAGAGIDPERLAAEAALIADRSDVSEELVRLKVHFKEARDSLAAAGSGRRLDFLLQEFVREFNTIASKAADASVARMVVDAKAIVEKMREQVQNLE